MPDTPPADAAGVQADTAADAAAAMRLAVIVSLGGFVFGYDVVVMSGVTGAVTARFGLSEWQTGWMVGVPTLTAMFASLGAGVLSDRFGRRTMLRVVAALYVVSSVMSAFADGFYGLVLARAVAGLALSSLVLAPIYLAEISPAAIRGRIVSMNQLAIALGFSAAYFSNFGLQALGQSGLGWVSAIGLDLETWRWMLGAGLLPAVTWLVVLLTLTPESPRWLALKGRAQEARAALARLHGPGRVEAVFARVTGQAEAPPRAGAAALLLSRPVRLALALGLVVACAQQITGVNAIYFYAPIVFEQTGVGVDAALLNASLMGVVNVAFTVLAMVLVDRVGRKPLLLIGLAGVAVSTLLVAFAFSQAHYVLTPEAIGLAGPEVQQLDLSAVHGVVFSSDVSFKTALTETLGVEAFRQHQSELLRAGTRMNAGLILFGILLFVASFAVSLGPVTWVFLSEIFPGEVRGAAIGLVAFINGLVSFLVQLLFPVELAQLGVAATFAIYGVIAALFFIAIAALVPETRGRQLEASE
jgi:MFS transporter, SP family, arabinose:H+ symporter